MEPSFTYKHIKSSEEVNAYATKKLSKINKYKDFKISDAKYVFETSRDDSLHTAELIVHIKHDTISASANAKNMYQAIDGVVTKICKQLEKKKTHYIKSRHSVPKEIPTEEDELE